MLQDPATAMQKSVMKKSRRDEGPRRSERILVIEDDLGVGTCIHCILEAEGYLPVVTDTAGSGLERVEEEAFDLVITDLKLPDSSGLDVVRTINDMGRGVPIILMTSFSTIETAIEALQNGAVDYIIKPFSNDDFVHRIGRALKERRVRRENAILKRTLRKAYSASEIIGESDGIKRVVGLIRKVASFDATVLIRGESGTGKELVAQAIHYASDRAEGSFVPLNCGAIPAELLESELFGHTRGAFTGATEATEGLIREADGGTLFLDEISELAPTLQVKLLRALQEKQVRPLGSKQVYPVNVRFLAATNKNLREAIERGEFRKDLFYRLNVINIHIPPLRERGKDVELLTQYFIEKHSRRLGKRIAAISREMRDFLYTYQWPGNVRELENVIERGVILAEGDVLGCKDFVEVDATDKQPFIGELMEKPLSVEEYIKQFVRHHQDTHTETELASMLGITRKVLWLRRNKWGLHRGGSAHQQNRSRQHKTSA